jgi:hypothetical protein
MLDKQNRKVISIVEIINTCNKVTVAVLQSKQTELTGEQATGGFHSRRNS